MIPISHSRQNSVHVTVKQVIEFQFSEAWKCLRHRPLTYSSLRVGSCDTLPANELSVSDALVLYILYIRNRGTVIVNLFTMKNYQL